MIRRISTRGMTREEWLEIRRHSIGGSDAGIILGFNEYRSPFSLWAEKTGKVIPEDISDKESVRLGRDLEEYVSERFTEATGLQLRNNSYILYNDLYPFAHANIDRQLVGKKEGFEAKTTGSLDILHKCQAGDFPALWYAQIMHYLMITGFERWYLGVLCLGRGFYYFTIERNEEEISALAKAEAEFWHYVESGEAPPIDGSISTAETISALYPEAEESEIKDLSPISDRLEMYSQLSRQIKALERSQEEEKNAIKAFMEGSRYGTSERFKVDNRIQSGRRSLDLKAYEADNGIIPDQYFKTGKEYRVLTIKEI